MEASQVVYFWDALCFVGVVVYTTVVTLVVCYLLAVMLVLILLALSHYL